MLLMRTEVLVILLAIGLVSHPTEAHPDGQNIDNACSGMVPFHGVPAKTSPPPYSIAFSSESYTPGTAVLVTIKACTATGFKGFLIEARRASVGTDQGELLGSFTSVAGTQPACQGKGLVHTDNSEKSTLSFNWNPPSTPQGHIQFRVTFVQQKSTLWAAVISSVLIDSSIGTALNPTLVTPTTTVASECNALPDGRFLQDPACNDDNCFSDCDQNGCTFQIKFQQDGDYGEYSIKTKAEESSTDMYALVGFSVDQTMGQDSVSGCIFEGGNTRPLNAYNSGKKPPEILTNDDVTVTSNSYEKGIFSCTFKRLIAARLDGKQYDLSKSWYLLFARGSYKNGLQYHFNNKRSSSKRYSLTGSNQVGTLPTNPPVSNVLTKDPDCDNDNCFSDCGQNGCTFQVKFQRDGDFGEYTIKTKAMSSPDMYAAIGFSSDSSMGKDSVSGCTYQNGVTQPFNAYNDEKSPPEMLANDGVTLTSDSYENGIFSCSFKRAIAAGLDGKRYDLSTSWYLLFAKGSYDNGLKYHFANKQASSQRYSLTGSNQVGTLPPEIQPTNPPVSNVLTKDPDCDNDNCFSDCGQNGCTFQVKFQRDGDFGEYTIKTKAISSPDMYAAIGFSSDSSMGKDSVSGCTYQNGVTQAFNAYNDEKSPPKMLANDGVTLTSDSYENGIFSCSFKRAIAAGLDGKRYDLSTSWYLLFAKGSYDNGLKYHFANKQPSSQRYSLTGSNQQGTLPPETTDPPLSGEVSLPSSCGSSKGCISKCSGSSCDTVLSWEDDGDSVIYTLSSVVSLPAYIAIGFSSDEKMGGDSVSGCAANSGGLVRVFSAENPTRATPKQFEDSDVTLQQQSVVDNVLTCTIKRLKSASSDGKRFDVTKKWFILIAKGQAEVSANSITLRQHKVKDRFFSPEKFSSNDRPNAGAKSSDNIMIKAHGSLMIGAWIFFASIGMVAARYYKPVWKDDLCSQKVWFQIHRTCMILAFCATVSGFVIIFVEKEEWITLNEEDEYLNTHPILGVIVTALAVINPIMALFRPHPGTENRWIFNWGHWFVGNSAYILGVITIFFGVKLQVAEAPDYMVYILAGYVAWQLFVTLFLEIMLCYGHEKSRRELYEVDDLQNQKTEPAKETAKTLTIKRVLLMVHVFVLTALSCILIGFVCIGEEELDH